MLAFLSQSCGVIVFITYASTIFASSGTNFSPEMSSIVLAVVQIVGTYVATLFIETQGRKFLMIVSLSGCTFGLLAMTTYLYCNTLGFDVSMFKWVPVTSLGFVILISAVGIVPVSMLCLVESLPTKMRSFGLTLGTGSMSFFGFVVIALYPFLIEVIHMHGCMFSFAVISAIGVLFVIHFVDETKGKILDLLNEEKSNETSVNA